MHAPLPAPILFGLFQFDDPVGLLFTIIVLVAGFIMLCCAFGTPGESNTSMMVLLFCVTGILLVCTTQVFAFYFLWELTAFAAWGVGRLSTRGSDAIMGPLPWQGAGGLGSISLFSAVLLIMAESRAVHFADLTTANIRFVAVLVLIGVILKSIALFSHAWHDGQPYTASLSSGLLAGVGVILIGIYPFLRLFNSLQTDVGIWREIVPNVGLPLSLIAGLAALGGRDLPSVVSNAALSQWALLLVGVVGSEPRMLTATLLQCISYALTVLLLFVCVGMVLRVANERDLRYLGGLAARMPFTASLFLLATLALVGIPPFSSFVSRLLAASTLDVTVLLARGLLEALAMLALLRAFYLTFLGRAALGTSDETMIAPNEIALTAPAVRISEGAWLGVLVVTVCLAGLIWLAFEPNLLVQLITSIVSRWQA